MTFLTNTLGPHWLALALLAVAVVAAVWRWQTAGGRAVAFACGALGLGGLGLGFTRFDDFDLPPWLAVGSAALLVLAFARLVWVGSWSFALGLALAALLLLGLGGLLIPDLGKGLAEAGRSVRGLEFVRPWWLVLLVCVPPVFLISRRSLSGLGPVRRWVAVGTRALVLTLLVVALAEPRVRRPSENVTVLFVIDRTLSVPPDYDLNERDAAGDPIDRRWERVRRLVNDSVRLRGPDHRDDQAGVILFGRRPKLVLPPAAVDLLPIDERLAGPIDGQYTDIAAALKLALASFPEGTGKRVVLISDGNENVGRAEAQALLAKQQGVQIDVLPLGVGYKNENEVLVQAVEAPPFAAQGQRLPVRVLVRNAHPSRLVDGVLELVQIRDREARPVPILDGPQVLAKPEQPGPARVQLRPGLNVFKFRDRADDPAIDSEVSFTYRATFTPTRSMDANGGNVVQGLPGDRSANNRATASVVARGQRRVLFVEDPPEAAKSPHKFLTDTLRAAKFRLDVLPADKLPDDPGDLGVFLSNYDCLILANVPAEWLSPAQQEVIRQGVSDQGLGLVMVGGPTSFGPGGYQQTAVETALPVDCDIKSLQAAGKGGLVLIMHASEMADGNRWQKEIAKLAIDRLGPIDMVGVLYYGFGAGSWFIPFQEVGADKSRLHAQLDRMQPGDMPDFDPFLVIAADTLADPKYGLAVKHTIVISDGDPVYGGTGQAAVAKMAANGITCTTVGVATHGGAEDSRLQTIATGAKGNFYRVNDPSKLPSIYVKEARRVSQSFLYTDPFDPKLRIRGGPTARLPDALPRLHGFVRTTLKPDAFVEMGIEGPTVKDQRFPVLAYRQYGAGRSVAYTSDARSQPGGVLGWDREWVGSDIYQKFWEQLVGWAMRTAETGRLAILSEYRDGRVRLTVDARDEKDRPLQGISLRGTVSPPRPPAPGEKPPTVEFLRTGSGRFEAEFAAEEAGAYFVYVQAVQNGQIIDGARAGVTVPYSPEFADLETNPALLKRLAEITGGKEYAEGDEEKVAKSGDVFRDAPKTVRALLPFWFWLVFAAGVLLVFDVGVRRVSLEPAEVRAAAVAVWTKLRSKAAKPAAASEGLDRLRRAKEAVGERIEQERAGRRFDPTAAPPADAPVQTADELASAPPPPVMASPPPPPRLDKPPEGDDFFTRMHKAKKRAQTDKPDGERPPG
jgi:uncharacterized membrane protein